PQNDVTLKMPAFEWVHVQLHQQKGMISLSPPTICNSAIYVSVDVKRAAKQRTSCVGLIERQNFQYNSRLFSFSCDIS
ncbi:hypothetical protein ACJTED_13935, partial [Klebsiella pneumoniae]|uniref:hypothetical protein n=1 Tax=Klebsiella pneumoniae TaxID=573 RepID=UPI00387EE353